MISGGKPIFMLSRSKSSNPPRNHEGMKPDPIAADHSCTNPVFPWKRFDEWNDILVELRFLAIDLRQRGDQFCALLLAQLLLQVLRELLESARILEEVTAFLETIQVADIHIVTGECPLDCREGIDRAWCRPHR